MELGLALYASLMIRMLSEPSGCMRHRSASSTVSSRATASPSVTPRASAAVTAASAFITWCSPSTRRRRHALVARDDDAARPVGRHLDVVGAHVRGGAAAEPAHRHAARLGDGGHRDHARIVRVEHRHAAGTHLLDELGLGLDGRLDPAEAARVGHADHEHDADVGAHEARELAISPGPDAPELAHEEAGPLGDPQHREGAPTSLLNEPRGATGALRPRRMRARRFFVVVLPLEPVMPTTRSPPAWDRRRRHGRGRRARPRRRRRRSATPGRRPRARRSRARRPRRPRRRRTGGRRSSRRAWRRRRRPSRASRCRPRPTRRRRARSPRRGRASPRPLGPPRPASSGSCQSSPSRISRSTGGAASSSPTA